MKLLKQKVSRKGDRMTVTAEWRDRMRRPAGVQVSHSVGDPGTDVLLDGESHEVFTTFSGIADIAWAMGWRPAGLPGAVANMIQNYKPPTEE